MTFITKEVLQQVGDNLLKQGFSITLLMVVVWYMHNEMSMMKTDATQRDNQLRQEIRACTDAHIEYLHAQQDKTTQALINASKVMERLEKKLE